MCSKTGKTRQGSRPSLGWQGQLWRRHFSWDLTGGMGREQFWPRTGCVGVAAEARMAGAPCRAGSNMRWLFSYGNTPVIRWEAGLGDLHAPCQPLLSASKGHQVGSGQWPAWIHTTAARAGICWANKDETHVISTCPPPSIWPSVHVTVRCFSGPGDIAWRASIVTLGLLG